MVLFGSKAAQPPYLQESVLRLFFHFQPYYVVWGHQRRLLLFLKWDKNKNKMTVAIRWGFVDARSREMDVVTHW
jgi:hypothetical protein